MCALVAVGTLGGRRRRKRVSLRRKKVSGFTRRETEMKRWKALLLVLFAVAIAAAIYGAVLIGRGFSATEEPSRLEKMVARTVRNLAIPRKARNQENPWKATPEILREAREDFTDRCAVCHG